MVGSKFIKTWLVVIFFFFKQFSLLDVAKTYFACMSITQQLVDCDFIYTAHFNQIPDLSHFVFIECGCHSPFLNKMSMKITVFSSLEQDWQQYSADVWM